MPTNTSNRNDGQLVDVTSLLAALDDPGSETLESALAACGWVAQRDGNSWSLGSGRETATLTELQETADWRHFALCHRRFSKLTNECVLSGNRKFPGPMKLVAQQEAAPICRLDVPTEFVESAATEISSLNSLAAMSPTFFWANAVTTGLATWLSTRRSNSKADDYERAGEPKFAAPLPAEEIAAQLQAGGWVTTAEEGRVYVNVSLPGIFRQVEIANQVDDDGRQQTVLGCSLVELPAGEFDVRASPKNEGNGSIESSPSARAIVQLAHHVNARLPLVRMTLDTSGNSWKLRSEVSFCGGPIPGAWLTTALDAVQSAIATTALEFEALRRDAELARLVLAAVAG